MISLRKDTRYSIQLEYCGYARRRWVVRFCGDWVGAGENRTDANAIARRHIAARVSEMESAA
jgi:hypothetical protein